MKSIIAAGLLLGAAHGTVASAGTYANVENNALWTGGDYDAAVTEVHAGYEFDNGIYVQGGPAFVSVDGEDLETEYSGKVGITSEVSDNVEVYGEVAFITDGQSFDEDLNIGTKVGLTYRF
tara:strand:+ start:899 stop:1261 length:363 start_codon:yes stop_codon:yes gene_type:complete